MIYDYEYFKKEIYSLTTIDLNAYKEKQMKRRIDTLIAKHKIVGYDKYVQALKTDKVLFEEFVGYITINVSESRTVEISGGDRDPGTDPAFWQEPEGLECCMFHGR